MGISKWMVKVDKIIVILAFFLFFAFLLPGNGQIEKKDVSTIFLIDCSGSMVSSIHKNMESKGLLKSYTEGQFRLFSLPPDNIAAYLNNPENKNIISDNIMFKSCEALEEMIKNYSQGPIEIITYRNGSVDMDGDAPLKAFFSGYVDPSNPESKQKILKFINPMKYGKLDNAPMWNGLLWETIKKGGGPTNINKSCKLAMGIFNNKNKQPGFLDKTSVRKLILFTDGTEMEKGSTFQKIIDTFKLEKKDFWYEYKEPREQEKISAKKVTIKISADSLKGSLKEDSLTPPSYNAEAKLSPVIMITVARDDKAEPRGQIAVTVSRESGDSSIPLPSVFPSIIESADFNEVIAFKFLFSNIKPFFNTLPREKEIPYRITLNYKPADGENIDKKEQGVPVTVKMIPGEKRITIVPPAGFVTKPAPDGVVWELADAKEFKAKYTFSVDFSKAPANSSVLVELQKDPPSAGIKLTSGNQIDKMNLVPEAGKKASFDVHIDLERPEEKITAVLSAKATPLGVNVVPSKASFSIVNPMKIFKIVWKDSQNQDAQAPKSIDYGKIKIKKIKSGDYVKPSVSGFMIQPERSDLFPANAPVDVSLEGAIASVMGLKIEGAGRGEVSLKDCPANKVISLSFQENLKPGIYSGTLVINSSKQRVDITPPESKKVPVSIEIQGGGMGIWILLIIIILIFLLILLFPRKKKEEKAPKAAESKPAQTP